MEGISVGETKSFLMKILQIKETCFYSRDLNRVREFYHGKLGLPVISEVSGKHIFFRAGTSVLLCFNPDDSSQKESPPAHYAEGPIHFAFEVESGAYDETKKELESKEIKIVDEVKWPGGGSSFYFLDPFGNVVEVLPERGIWD